MPLSSFHKFAALPPELRLCVWHWALRIPQIVAISSDEELRPIPTEELDDEDSYNYKFIDTSRTRGVVDGWVKAGFLSAPSEHSPLLRVNAEARYEAQKRYGPFGIPTAGRRQPGLNVNIDVLWLPHPQDVEGFVYTIWQSTVPWLLLGYRRLALPWLFFEKALSHIDMRMEERISTRFRLMPMDRWLWTLLMISLIDEMILVVGQEDIPSYTTSMSMPAAVPRSQVLDTLLEESLPGIKVECLEKALTRVMREYKKWWILWLEIMVPTYGSSAARFLRYQRQTKIVRNWRTPSIKIRQMKNGF